MFKSGFAVLVLFLAACTPNTDEVFEGPDMGPVQLLKGVWLFGFELSQFTYCAHGYNQCRGSLGMNGECWLEGTGEAPGQLKKLIGRDLQKGDAIYLEFEGRETKRRGQYGHMGEYSCQVKGTKLLSAKIVEL